VTGTPAGAFVIRELGTHDELRRCVRFQHEIWGEGFAEAVPAAILWVATRTGGIVAGAFTPDRSMVGFLFGLSGWRDGRPVHWSDMLAVLPAARGQGLGRSLKEFQRRTLIERGIHDVFWTFDPLESRNAWINFARLGITAREYARECYGESDSPLHAGIGTDRLIACWQLTSPRVRSRMEGGEPGPGSAAGITDVPLVYEHPGEELRLDLGNAAVRVRVPADIQTLKASDAAAARLWRLASRSALETYLGRGYVVEELVRESADHSSYVLRAPSAVQA
jgi:predicted GNAT superfamily acetyltransferase